MIKNLLVKYANDLSLGGAGLVLGIVAVGAVFYTPRPNLIDEPKTTKEEKISLRGKAEPNASVAVFDKSGAPIDLARTNENGEFLLKNLPIDEGKNIFNLRTVSPVWRISVARRVVIEKDTLAPILKIDPLAQAVITGSNTTISGQTEKGAAIAINGVKALVAEDGTWTASLALKSGTNTIAITAADPAGNTTTHTQIIQYVLSSNQLGIATFTSSTSSTALATTVSLPDLVKTSTSTPKTKK